MAPFGTIPASEDARSAWWRNSGYVSRFRMRRLAQRYVSAKSKTARNALVKTWSDNMRDAPTAAEVSLVSFPLEQAYEQRLTQEFMRDPKAGLPKAARPDGIDVAQMRLVEMVKDTWELPRSIAHDLNQAADQLTRAFRAEAKQMTTAHNGTSLETLALGYETTALTKKIETAFLTDMVAVDFYTFRDRRFQSLTRNVAKAIDARLTLIERGFLPAARDRLLSWVEPDGVQTLFQGKTKKQVPLRHLPPDYINGDLNLEDQMFQGVDLAPGQNGDLTFQLNAFGQGGLAAALRQWQGKARS